MDMKFDAEQVMARNIILEKRVSVLETTIIDLTARLMAIENGKCSYGFELNEASEDKTKNDKREVTALVMADSQRNDVSPNGLSFGDRKTLVWPTPTLEQVPEVIAKRNKEETAIKPDTVLLASGTNTWDSKSDEVVIEEMKSSVEKIQLEWPDAKVKVQEFLPRKDKTIEEMSTMNEKIRNLAKDMGCELVQHRVSHFDLKDKKHVKPNIVYKIALMWKYAVNPKGSRSRRSSDRDLFRKMAWFMQHVRG